MEKSEYNLRLLKELTTEEAVLINTNIYYNEDHLHYYNAYHREAFDECYEYLMRHRDLLQISHTPERYKSTAKLMIKNAKQLIGQ